MSVILKVRYNCIRRFRATISSMTPTQDLHLMDLPLQGQSTPGLEKMIQFKHHELIHS